MLDLIRQAFSPEWTPLQSSDSARAANFRTPERYTQRGPHVTASRQRNGSFTARAFIQCKCHKTELALLLAWIGFFFFVNAFVTSLNKITVPLIELPLGLYLAAQGSVIIFFVLLYLFCRQRG